MDFTLINVGIAGIDTAKSPDILRTIIGSCVAICLYEPNLKVGGLSHIMLPVNQSDSPFSKKYADTAIPILLTDLAKLGAEKENLTAKVVGGASMFNLSRSSKMGKIGRDNVTKVKEILEEMNIRIASEDVGGNSGRTMDFFLENGKIKIKSLGKTERVI